MTEPTELLPCPFCGAGESQIHVNKGTWNGRGYGEPVSVEVRHWCADVPGQPSRMISRAGRDEASAIAAWNTRTTPQPAQAQAGAVPLTDEQIKDEASHHGFIGSTEMLVKFVRGIETEVRKQDDALIRQLVEALKYHRAQTRPIHQTNEAIVAGRARLEGKP